MLRDREPRRPGRHPDDSVDHRLDLSGRQGDRPAVVGHRDPIADAGGARGGRDSASRPPVVRSASGTARRPLRGCRPVPAARWPAPPSVLRPPRRTGSAARRRCRAGWPVRRSSDPARPARPPPGRWSGSRAAGPDRRPGRPARAGRVMVCALGSTTGKGRSRPSQFTKLPARSCIKRHRQHDVGPFGDQRRPGLQADDEVDLLQSLQCSRPDPGSRWDRRRPRPAPPARRRWRRAGSRRRRDRATTAGTRSPRSPRRRSGPPDRPPAGRPAAGSGRQPASTAPRSPARRGTQASRAPVRSASRRHARQRAGRDRRPLADHDHRVGVQSPSVEG